MYDPVHEVVIANAISRLFAELPKQAPFTAVRLSHWMKSLSENQQPEYYFKHPRSFPFLLIPWWLENKLCDTPNIAFQTDLVYASVNAYYFTRLVDNLMDGHATVEADLLPMLAFFHVQWQTTYQPHFHNDHPFWDFYTSTWIAQSDSTAASHALEGINQRQFTNLVSQKVCGAKIPMAAVCYRCERPDLIEPWSQFIDRFGRWHLMEEDLFDWKEDEQHKIATYFLSEANARKAPQETAASWVIREGFDWGIQMLNTWMAELKIFVNSLDVPEVKQYLEKREQILLDRKKQMSKGLNALARLLAAMEKEDAK